MTFKVVEVIDGNTFRIYPGWKIRGKEGDIVGINGCNAPKQGQLGCQAAKEKLEKLILDNHIELKKPVKITYGKFPYGRLLSDVYLDEESLVFFLEHQ